MLQVRKCTIVMNGSNALSGGTTISMNRLKQVLASHLSELDGLTGRIHIKKLTLDLGMLTQVEFDKDFFDRFELVCGKFKEKLIALHHDQQADISDDDEEKLQQIMDHLYSIEQTGNVRKLQHFIESLKRAPQLRELNDLQSAYAKQFSNSMPTETLELLMKILEEIENSNRFPTTLPQKKDIENQSIKGDFVQKDIDFLLFLLENTRIDNSWLKQISKAFEKKTGRSIPSQLLSALKSTFEEFQWGNEPKRNISEKRYLNKTEDHLLREYLHLYSDKSDREALVQLLEIKQKGLNEQSWYAQLLEGYYQRFRTDMPSLLQEQLLRYNAWKKRHSWNQIDRQTRDLLQKKLKGDEVEKSVVKNKSVEKTAANEYTFILELLERIPINAAWFSQISTLFRREFGRKLPQVIENHLLEFSSNLGKEHLQDDKVIVQDLRANGNWKAALLHHLNKYPEMGVFSELINKDWTQKELDAENWLEKLENAYYLHTNEHPVRSQRIILKKFKRQLKEKEFKELFSLTQKEFELALKTIDFLSKKWTARQKNNRQKEIIQMFTEVDFSESWMADIKKRYEENFKTRIPEKLFRALVDFANGKLETLEKERERMSQHRKQEQISLIELKENLLRQTPSRDLDALLDILPGSDDPQKFSEIQHIISGFEAYYSKPIPAELRKLLFAFYTESKKKSIGKPTNDDLVFFEATLKEQLNSTKETTKAKAKIRPLNNEIKQLLSIMDEVQLTHRWKRELEKLYQKRFGTSISKELENILGEFLKTLEANAESNLQRRKQEQISLTELKKNLLRQTSSRDLNALLDILPGSDDPQKFSEIQHIISVFEAHYSKPIPAELKKLLFAFYTESKKKTIGKPTNDDLAFFEATLKEQLNSIKETTKAKAKIRPLKNEIKQLLSIMDEVQLTHRWKTELEKLYQKRFGTSISKELESILEEFLKTLEADKKSSQLNEQQKIELKSASIKEWNDYLKSNLEVYGVDQLQQLLSMNNAQDLWSIEQMTQIYEDSLEQRLPMVLNALLMQFWREDKAIPEDSLVQNRVRLTESLRAQMREVELEENEKKEVVQEEEIAFFQTMIERFSMDASWLPRTLKEYENVFNRKIPADVRDILFAFTQRIKKTFDEAVTEKSTQRNSRMNLERFLKEHESQNGVSQLLELVRASKGLDKSSWFSKLLREYRSQFQSEMPVNCQELLLSYSADFEWNTWKMVPSKLRNELISQVKPVLVKLSKEEKHTEENTTKGIEELGFLLSLLEVTPIDAGWLATILKQFKLKFNTELSVSVKQLLMDFSIQLYAESSKEFVADEESSDHLSLEILSNNLSADLSAVELKWVQTIFLKSRKTGEWKNWVTKFFEICSKNGHSLSENKCEQLIQFDVHWKNALKISKSQQLQKILGVLVSNYFVKIRSSIDDSASLEEIEKENFTLAFIQKTNDRLLVDFMAEWKQRFQEEMDPELKGILCEYGIAIQLAKDNQQSVKSLSSADEKSIEITISDDIEQSTKEKETEKEYLVAMSQELIDGWINLHDLEMGYQQVFGKELTEQLNSIFKNLPFPSMETRSYDSILREFRKFLENSKPTKSVHELFELLDEEIHCSPENWFEVVMNTYADRWKTTMPFPHQQLLLNFAQTRKSEPDNHGSLSQQQMSRRTLLLEKWEGFLKSEQRKFVNGGKSDSDQQADFITSFLKTHTLDATGFELLKKIFEAKFSCKIVQEWLAFLTEQERSISLKKNEQLAVISRQKRGDFKQTIVERIEKISKSKETDELINLVQESNGLTVENWFQQLLQAYSKIYSNQMPIGHQAVLLEIAKDEKLFIDEKEAVLNEKNVFDRKAQVQKEIEKHFFSYSNQHGKNIKGVLKQIMANCFSQPFNENWMAHFSASYEEFFKAKVPRELQEKMESLSLEFAQKIRRDEPTELSMEDEVIEEVKNFFMVNSEEIPTQKAHEIFIIEHLKNTLLNEINKKELDLQFSDSFGISIPEEISQLLDQTIAEKTNDPTQQFDFLKAQFSALSGKTRIKSVTMPSAIRKERNYLPSNKVRLLKLKEKLKQLQKGKKEEPDIPVSNAGIIIGWVLWKSIFTQFGWLKEGKFIHTEEIDTRQMAASWLHLSVGEDPENANPLILFMCGIEEYDINPISKERLQEQLGATDIDASINDYYEMLLSMWPIFEPSQVGDLIELFIRREGLMKSTGLGMKLRLVKEPYDLLRDKNPIPWPISLINFSWTTSIIEVEW